MLMTSIWTTSCLTKKTRNWNRRWKGSVVPLRTMLYSNRPRGLAHAGNIAGNGQGGRGSHGIFTSSLTGAMMVLTAKLYAALHSDSYLVCMQNAAIIRSEAEYLRLSSHMLNSSNDYDRAYVAVFREDMEKFRALFAEWTKKIHSMDKDDIEDDWGLLL